jgi:hypothetical protein
MALLSYYLLIKLLRVWHTKIVSQILYQFQGKVGYKKEKALDPDRPD